MAVNGNNILIYMDGSVVAGTRSDEVQTDCGLIEVSSPSNGGWQTFLAGRKSWSVNIAWLVTQVSDINRLLLTGTTVTVQILGRGASTGLTGSAIVKTCKMTATRGNLANGTLVLQGSGPLSSGSVSNS